MARRLHLDLAVAIATAAAFVADVADASPLIETAGSVGGNAGYQGVVSGPGAASTYFNPALLVDADDDVLLAFALITEQLGATLDGRPGGDVPLSVGGRNIVDPNGNPISNGTVPTQWLQQGCPPGTTPGSCPPPGFAARPRQSMGTSGKTRTYLTLGLVKTLIDDRLTVGFYGMLPISSFTTARAFYPDEREALFSNSLHPELYGDRLTAVSLAFGAGLKLLPTLSVGLALSVGFTNEVSSQDYVQDATNYNSLLLNNSVTTQVAVAPTAGVRWKPYEGLRIGGAVHAPESFTVSTSIDNTLPSGTESSTTQNNVFDWMPWSVAFGVEGEVVRRRGYTMSIVGSLDYAFWSSYQDRHGQSPAMYGRDLAWRDTVSGALGVRHVTKSARAFMDLHYVPTPVPAQLGRSNYVDNDRVGLAAGGDVLLHLPTAVRPGVQLFVDRFVPRHQQKDSSRIVDELPDGSVFVDTHDPVPGAGGLQTNNPGWPGFSSGGWIWGGAVTISVPL